MSLFLVTRPPTSAVVLLMVDIPTLLLLLHRWEWCFLSVRGGYLALDPILAAILPDPSSSCESDSYPSWSRDICISTSICFFSVLSCPSQLDIIVFNDWTIIKKQGLISGDSSQHCDRSRYLQKNTDENNKHGTLLTKLMFLRVN